MEITKKLQFIMICCLLAFFLLTFGSKTHANAADIVRSSTIEINYTPENDYVTIKHTIVYNINNSQIFYDSNTKMTVLLQDFKIKPEESERTFKKNTLQISDSDNNVVTDYTLTEKQEGLELKIGRNRSITSATPYQIQITYKTHELVSLKGNISSVYIPGISEKQVFDSNDNGISLHLDFNTKVIVPQSTPEPSEISPSTIVQSTKDSKKIYTINGTDLIGKMGWIQFGTQQFNYFKIVQNAPKTDYLIPTELSQISNLLSTNIFKIVLPREYSETNQKVFYKKISPAPTKVELDSEGNLIAQFEVPANQETQIIAEGYITTEKNSTQNIEQLLPEISMPQYIEELNSISPSAFDYVKYTAADTYWQKDDPTIKEASQKLSTDNQSVRSLILADYNFVISTLDYDYDKVNSANPRLGAVVALSTKKGVCMEYADLLIALLRAQGIPSRTAFGYGNDPLLGTTTGDSLNTTSVSNTRIGHQWVQVWIKDIGWVSIDPTWGETGREYIGPDLDHILWSAVPDLSNNTVFDTYLFSANKVNAQSFDAFDITIRTVNKSEFDQDVNSGNVYELNHFATESTGTNSSSNDDLSMLIKTTPLGKATVVVLPACSVLITLIIVMVGFAKFINMVLKPAAKFPDSKSNTVSTKESEKILVK